MGPRLAILAGKGVGPVRFGATVATIERLMEHPCDVKSENMCRYIQQAVEFTLQDGVVAGIYVHGPGRPTKNAQGDATTFGVFNGGLPPDLLFGMLPSAIEEKLGKATRVEKLDETGPFRTAERHFYDGLELEYDRYKNGNLIMGGVKLVKSSTPATATPAASAVRPAAPARSAAPATTGLPDLH